MQNSFRDAFSINLCAVLKRRGFTQKDLAAKLNVSTTSVNNWCNGVKYPRIDMIQRISEVLDVSVKELVSPEGSDRSPVEVEDAAMLQALHQNPRLELLLDKQRKMSDADIDLMIIFAERLLDE